MTVEAEVEISDEVIAEVVPGVICSTKKQYEEAKVRRFIDSQNPTLYDICHKDRVQVISEEWDTFVEKVRPKRGKAKDT